MKKYLIYSACALMTLGLASCHADDPLYSDVIPASVQKLPTGVSGVVTSTDGNALSNINVKLGDKTTATDANGHYAFDNVATGNYTITVEGTTAYQGASRELTVSNDAATQEYVANFTLYKNNKSPELTITTTAGGNTEVISEATQGNQTHGEVEIKIDAPADAVSEDVNVWITPIYNEDNVTKASYNTGETLLLGATLNSSKDVTLSKPINITFDVDKSVADVVTVKKYENGSWKAINKDADANGKITIATQEFTSFGLFLDMKVTTNYTNASIALTPAGYDNVNGASNYYFTESKYGYKSGTEITTTAANKLQGLMIEYLARTYGNKIVNLNGTYPVNQNIAAGTYYSLTGYQEYGTLTVSHNSTEVKANTYGTVKITAKSGTGAHNGGGN